MIAAVQQVASCDMCSDGLSQNATPCFAALAKSLRNSAEFYWITVGTAIATSLYGQRTCFVGCIPDSAFTAEPGKNKHKSPRRHQCLMV
jgi:hypothetical protein